MSPAASRDALRMAPVDSAGSRRGRRQPAGSPRRRGRLPRDDLERARSRTWAEIDLDAVAANVQRIRTHLPPSCRFMAVVKADGYGHGAVQVARAALEAGAQWLGVATVGEGLALRHAGVAAPVLVLGSATEVEAKEAVREGLSLTLTSLEAIPAIARAGARRARVHLKVDTGMTRLGVQVAEVPRALTQIRRAGLRLQGCYTHLASADEADHTITREQLNRFDPVAARIRRTFPTAMIHAANSAAALAHARSHYDMVRIGLAMYGLYPTPRFRERITLHPAMHLLSRVVRTVRAAPGTAVSYGASYRVLRPTTVATVACGYADGYPRLAGLNGEVVLGEERVHVAGRVCMDHLMVDADDHPVAIGDTVELFGRRVAVDEVAAWAHTISYEVVCGVGVRVPRVYLRDWNVAGVMRRS